MSPATWVLIAVVFAVGVLLLGISWAMLRSLSDERAVRKPSWLQLVDESLNAADAQLRADIVERLSILNTQWSRGVLEQAKSQEADAKVRSAIDAALRR